MNGVVVGRIEFLKDRQGRTFADVANDPQQPFDDAIAFFNDAGRQRRMEESEIHHDRAPLAGVVRELEAQPAINKFLSTMRARRSQRLRQAIGVMIRMIMERRGWKTTGKKGSLGVRSAAAKGTSRHNTGGLAFWFLRAERYKHEQGTQFLSVRDRCRELESAATSKVAKQTKRRAASKPRSVIPIVELSAAENRNGGH
jgi:hypothetical protein